MAKLTLMLKDRELKTFNLDKKKLVIGRNHDCGVVIDNVIVSREHAIIEFVNDAYLLSDLGSSNGTFLNGRKISEPITLSSDDTIQIGKFNILFTETALEGSFQSRPSSMDETMIVAPGQVGVQSTSPTEIQGRKLTLVSGQASPKELLLKKDMTTIGRAPNCDMIVSGLLISKVQASILKKGGKYYLVDMGSLVSTKLNGYKTEGDTLLVNGDSIQIRNNQFLFS